MKKLLFLILLLSALPCFAEGPRYRHPEAEKQLEFENVYRDLRGKLSLTNLLSSTNTWTAYQIHEATVDIKSGSVAGLTIGADNNLTTRTTNTEKRFRIASPPYTNGNNPVAILFGTNNNTSGNDINIGGGSLGMDAATGVHIYTAANITTVVGTERFRVDSTGCITQPTQPSFLVVNGTGPVNMTGDGFTATVGFPTEITDAGSNFATDTFTAPVTGKYILTAMVNFTNVTAVHTYRYMDILTSNRIYYNQFNAGVATNAHTLIVSIVADMDAGDTAKVRIESGGSTHTVGLVASVQANIFSGTLAN